MTSMVETKRKVITDADLLALGENVRAEVVDGELVVHMAPNKGDHGFFAARVAFYLDAFASARSLGRVFGDMTAFKLEERGGGIEGARVPDASFVSFERLPPDAPIDVILSVVPDLAVEVISESEAYTDVLDKTGEYLDHGVTQVWHVIPKLREIRVFTAGDRAGAILTEADTLTGGDLLPGFEVPVKAIFDHADTRLHVEVLRRLLEA
jgi:Uma2 family endonuclease